MTESKLLATFENELKSQTQKLESEITVKRHLIIQADSKKLSIMPRLVTVFNLYGSMGALNYETTDLNHVQELVEAFPPVDIYTHADGCRYFKPWDAMRDNEKAKHTKDEDNFYGVMYDVSSHQQEFEWFTEDDNGKRFRITVNVSPWGLGGRTWKHQLPMVSEHFDSGPFGHDGRLLDWGITNPRSFGCKVFKMSGAPGCSGSGRILWLDEPTFMLALEDAIYAEEAQC